MSATDKLLYSHPAPVFEKRKYLQCEPTWWHALTAAKSQADAVAAFIKEMDARSIRYVMFCFTSLIGDLRCMEECLVQVPKVLEHGLGIDGSSVPGFAHIEKSDIMLMGDVHTAMILKHDEEQLCRIMCHVRSPVDKSVHGSDPRVILARTVDQARALGMEPYMMSELEFYVFDAKTRAPVDSASYLAMAPNDKLQRFRHEFGDILIANGYNVRRIHHENGPAQAEVELDLTPAMKNADDTLGARWVTELVASKYGWITDTDPKPMNDQAGSGLHQHVMLLDKDGKNVFAGEKALSEAGLHFAAGLVQHAREIAAVFARKESCFRRLKPGFEAPVYATWGYLNRSAMIRIPAFGTPQGIKIEFRAGDNSGSVHLLAAMILAAGLDGIEKKTVCPAPMETNCDTLTAEQRAALKIECLPTSIEEANQLLESSPFIHSVLGKEQALFLAHYDPKAHH